MVVPGALLRLARRIPVKGDPDVIQLLNAVLTSELTAINQYFVHYRMCENWGYARLAKKKREESIDEMKHADRVIQRILFLDGTPNMQRLSPVRVGEHPIEQHEVDLALELEAVKRLNEGIALAVAKGDNGTRDLLESILHEEEQGIDWLEAQLSLARQLGTELYLSDQMRE
jgi:bacterioferritin